ncbi:Resistin-like alpha [Cricetulus griseus]|uniref:Resistin-like alpha n=1 Tax=Cricetulus griseus TaxID=10029 RepID=G3H7D0_CRIGR|nr:Resistin-like alpha [Cricetulus griseus]
MKPTICFLLIFVSLLHLMSSVNTQSSKDSWLTRKIQEALNGKGHHWDGRRSTMTTTLSCTSVKAMGTLSSCPSAMPELSDLIFFSIFFQHQDIDFQQDEDYNLLPSHLYLLSPADGPNEY